MLLSFKEIGKERHVDVSCEKAVIVDEKPRAFAGEWNICVLVTDTSSFLRNHFLSLADTYINGRLKDTLALNGIDFDKDWKSITREEGAAIPVKVRAG